MGYTYTDFAGLRVPDENAADDVPVELSFLAEQLDTAVKLEAASAGERDSKFYDAPSGVLCVVKNPDDAVTDPGKVFGLYVKTSNAGTSEWSVVWEPPYSATLVQISLADPYTTRGTPTYDPGVWKENSVFAQMKGSIVRVDGTSIASGSTVGYLPSGFMPMFVSADYPVATALDVAAGAGSRKLSIASDGSLTYYGPAATWLGFDGIRYFLAPS